MRLHRKKPCPSCRHLPPRLVLCRARCAARTNQLRLIFIWQCWCAVDPDLTKIDEELELAECDMACAGTTSDEFCGGIDKLTAYKIEDIDPDYIGCYEDASDVRAMNMEGKYVSEDMTNEVRTA